MKKIITIIILVAVLILMSFFIKPAKSDNLSSEMRFDNFVTNSSWLWEQSVTVSTDQTVTSNQNTNFILEFKEDGSVLFMGDCNLFSGEYTQRGNSFNLFLSIATQEICPDSQEEEFVLVLNSAHSFLSNGKFLVLFGNDKEVAFSRLD